MPAKFASDAPGMQPEPWRSYFPSLSFEPHPGQREAYEVAAAGDPAEDKLVVLPTGYGKTRAAAGYYAISRERELVNRCLWAVSSDLQRSALSPEPDRGGKRAAAVSDDIADWFGLPCLETVTITGAWHEIKMHRAGVAEIFVTSYAFLRQQATYFSALLETGDWLLIGDEAHHLREGGAWAAWLERLPRVGTLYMSATPLRTDRLPLKNVPRSEDGSTFKAAVEVPVKRAIEDHAVRKPIAHAQEWELEFTDNNGKLVTYTTSQLRDEDIKDDDDFDAWVVKHDLKYTMAHLQRIVLDAVDRLNEKRASLPGKSQQMLVFAMSQNHAKFLANHVFPSIGYPVKTGADWIGMNRNAAENKDVVRRYKRGELPVLIQVDKAGEGFDHKEASVGLFLNMVTSETKLLQQLGRLMRRMFDIDPELDEADVFAETSHPILGLVRSMEPDNDGYHVPERPGGGGEHEWPPLPTLLDIQARWLETQIYGPGGSAAQAVSGILRAARKFGLTTEDIRQIVQMATGREMPQSSPLGEVGRRALLEAKVESTMSLITTHAIKAESVNGIENPRQLAGWIKKNLNVRWKQSTRLGHKEMMADDFAKKYEWLRDVHEEMRRTRRAPSWLIAPPAW